MENNARNFTQHRPQHTPARITTPVTAPVTAPLPAVPSESPIRFRNAIQRDDAIGTLLDILDLGDLWDDGGPTKQGYDIARASLGETLSPSTVIMRAACQLYRLHGGRGGPRNPNVDIIRFWELPSKALATFGSLMIAMAGGYDDVDNWIEEMESTLPEDIEDPAVESA